MNSRFTRLSSIRDPDPIESFSDSPLNTVDIVIPCYKYGHFLRSCVESVLAQQGVSVRILVIDDASPDDTSEVAQDLAASNRTVEFRRHDINMGHIATYNEGLISWSTADYVVLLSADDLLAPGALKRAVDIMEADKGIGMVYGRTLHFQQESELPKGREGTSDFDYFSGDSWLELRCRAGHNVISSPEVVVRGCVQRMVGGYRPELPHSGDLEMWLRIAAVSNIAYVRDVQAYYRVHFDSMQRTQFQSSLTDLIHRKAAFDHFFDRHGFLTDTAIWKTTVNRTLAREALWDACRAYDRNRLDQVRTDELLRFAADTYPRFSSLPEFASLRRRQRLGAFLCSRTQIFIIPAFFGWVRQKLKRRRMLQFGI
jgi:glycosyltransferase involved in cell wall biosynthesis